MYDLVVIGGGPGGYAAAVRASQLGAKVALIESSEIGGTCVNHGCIPSKIWLRAVDLQEAIKSGSAFGIRVSVESVDGSVIVSRKNGIAGDIRMGMAGLLSNNGIEVIEGLGILKSPGEISVDGKTVETKKIIIATGTSPSIPDIPGIEAALLTTEQVFDTTNGFPPSVLISGAGHIEVEMAALLNAFGVKVYLAFKSARILPEEDGDTGQRLGQALRDRGIELIPRVTLKSVKSTGQGFEPELTGSETAVNVDRVLVSARRPNTAGLSLEQAGVSVNDQGFVEVDSRQKTSADNIYAIGDVTGGRMLSYAATSMGVVAAENAFGEPIEFQSSLVPRGIFAYPEAAAVGLSEEEAEEKGLGVETGDFPYSINGLAMSYGELDGAVKIVSDAEYGEILGVHIVGPRATELIWGAVLAMQLEATAEDLARTMMVHPTFAESIAMASQDALGWALYLPK